MVFCSLDSFWYCLIYKPGLDCLRYKNYVLFLKDTRVLVQTVTNGRFGAKAELQQEGPAGLFLLLQGHKNNMTSCWLVKKQPALATQISMRAITQIIISKAIGIIRLHLTEQGRISLRKRISAYCANELGLEDQNVFYLLIQQIFIE